LRIESFQRVSPAAIALLSVLLTLPALWVGWQADDHYQRLTMQPVAGTASPPGLFSAFVGEVESNRQAVRSGLLPWWSSDEFRLSFLRELSVQSSRLDYALWPDSPMAMHAHSLLWLFSLVLAAAFAYRTLAGATLAATLGTLLFALDDVLAVPATWLANRYALPATLFALLAIAFHHRRGKSLAAAVASPVCLALALSAGEIALGAVGYLVAHALFVERTPIARRIIGLLPAFSVLLIWAYIYRTGEFGAAASGIYVDPLNDPSGFAQALLFRGPFLLMGLWWALPSELGNLPALWSVPWWGAALLLSGIALAVWIRRWRQDSLCGFWLVGMAISLVPVVGGFPSNRLLPLAAFGAMGFLGSLFADLWGARTRPEARWVVVVAGIWLLCHGVIAPVLRPMEAWVVRLAGEKVNAAADAVPLSAQKPVVWINAPEHLLFATNRLVRATLDGEPLPPSIRLLVAGPVALRVVREDVATLRIEIPQGMFRGGLGTLFADPARVWKIGQTIRLPEMQIVIAAVHPDGPPSALRIHLPESAELLAEDWWFWESGAFRRFEPPAVGESLSIAAPHDIFDYRLYREIRRAS